MADQQNDGAQANNGVHLSCLFKPYGSPPAFDLDEYKDTLELREKQWEVFLALPMIDTVLPQNKHASYKRNILLSCLSKRHVFRRLFAQRVQRQK